MKGKQFPRRIKDIVTCDAIRFLQFGSPHAVSAQAQYVCAEMSEVWVNIGYRLSAFGFLASHKPKLTGNYGFKDQWLALQWIRENIESFGGAISSHCSLDFGYKFLFSGDPDNIQIQGHSAGKNFQRQAPSSIAN